MAMSNERTEEMTEYGRNRESRRRQRTVLWVLYVVCTTALVSLKTGPLIAIPVALGLILLVLVVIETVVLRERRAEARRRAAGAPPSWPAQLPAFVANALGGRAPGRHSDRARGSENGEIFGRLTATQDGLRWEPSQNSAKRSVSPIELGWNCSLSVVPLWGPGSQGCLTLTDSDGTYDIWVRNPKDLSRTLGLATAN
jgi:hypothetical protein